MTDCVKIPEAAKLLKCSVSTIRNMLRSGKLEYCQPTRTILIPISALEELMQSSKRNV